MAFLDDTLEVTSRQHGAVTVIDIKGDVTTFADAKLTEAYTRATDDDAKKLVLNFHQRKKKKRGRTYKRNES